MKILEKTVENINNKFSFKWKDWIFGFGGLAFTVFLIPALFLKDKPPLITSIPTWLFLWLFVLAHSANKDHKGALWSFLCGSVWLVLAVQKLFF